MSPCTLLVEREFAITLPASCLHRLLSGMRSTKLVSSRLKPVVCELAMLPEMFSSAKDCARMPVTAVVRAPKIPITRLHLRLAANAQRAAGRNIGAALQAPSQREIVVISICYEVEAGPAAGQDAPPPARIAGRRRGQAGPAPAAGLNVIATPFMQ